MKLEASTRLKAVRSEADLIAAEQALLKEIDLAIKPSVLSKPYRGFGSTDTKDGKRLLQLAKAALLRKGFEVLPVTQYLRKLRPALRLTKVVWDAQVVVDMRIPAGHFEVEVYTFNQMTAEDPQAKPKKSAADFEAALPQLRPAILRTWQAIAEEDVGVSSNAEAMELCLDANRLANTGNDKKADDLLHDLIKKHGYPAVLKFLCKKISLY